MVAHVEVQEARTRRELKAFVRFPWRVYRGDHNWVPPLISERLDYLTPGKNPLLLNAETALFLARKGGQVAGTVAVLVQPQEEEFVQKREARFGFFEVLDDYGVAERLLDTARAWAKGRGVAVLRGPLNFTDWESPGVLIDGADCPPVLLSAHTPQYYHMFLERYGMEKDTDLYAWRAFRSQIGDDLEKVPEQVHRAAGMAARQNVTVRKVRLNRWAEEVSTACRLFNVTLSHLPGFKPITEPEFRRLVDPMRTIIDPDLALFAELEGRVVGFCVSLPDPNRVFIHLNGRLLPFGWLKLWWYVRRVDVLTFKLMGVLPELRYRGIEALLFVESLRAMMAKRYEWLDGSLTNEANVMVNLLASRWGAERYKHYRIYRMAV